MKGTAGIRAGCFTLTGKKRMSIGRFGRTDEVIITELSGERTGVSILTLFRSEEADQPQAADSVLQTAEYVPSVPLKQDL